MIDYRTDRFEDRARDIDVVFDAVGGETLKRSWSLLKPRGRIVTIAADSERTKDEEHRKSILHRRAEPERTDRDFPLARLG
jgi:NADPH:quinone reductase-like Zn-dependent oxidoreductase